MDSVFSNLYSLNVNEKVEKKNGLNYLSWAWAWAMVKQAFPDASYSIWKDANGLPFVYDPNTGYMVFTNVTINGVTHEMWLPVMDGANAAMKAEPYNYTVKKYGKDVTKTCQAATMFDINKTIMRCLTKNLAMFGLGLYIYAGEDLPETDDATEKPKQEEKPKEKEPEPLQSETVDREALMEETELRTKVIAYVNRHKMSNENIAKLCKAYGKTKLQDLTGENCKSYIAALTASGGDIDK